jgi:hypothetical protein
MVQQTAFSAVKVPFVSGIELGVSITSPSSASEDIATWLEEIGTTVDQLDTIIFTEIVNKADARGLTNFQRTGEKVMTLTTVIRRELAVAQAGMDALTPFLPDTLPEPTPPLRRHVALRRGEGSWRAAVDAWRAGEAEAVPAGEREADAHFDAVGDLFIALLNTPAPTPEAVAEKCALARQTGHHRTDEFIFALERDLKALVPSAVADALSEVAKG